VDHLVDGPKTSCLYRWAKDTLYWRCVFHCLLVPQTPLLNDSFETLPGGPTPQLPTALQGVQYTLDPGAWGLITGQQANAAANTDAMQDAIDWASAEGFSTFQVPAGDCLLDKFGNSIYLAEITLPDRMVLSMAPGARLIMAVNDKCSLSTSAAFEQCLQ